MTYERGARVSDYRAPLFLAWQLTNRCSCRCLHCCEESGPDKAWARELSREEALRVSREIVEAGIPYVAFGGGEPLGVPFAWDVFEILARGGVGLKLETNGLLIDEAAADRLKDLGATCVQISLDGPAPAVHEAQRPDGSFHGALESIQRLARRGLGPELVFVPTRLNVDSAARVYELAVRAGARTFVTGPLMRLGRAATSWDTLAPTPEAWERAVAALCQAAARGGEPVKLSIYPWDILEEIRVRRDSPQAMMLVVPDGKVKLLNALPFAVADLRRHSLSEAWPAVGRGWAQPRVREFTDQVLSDPSLLRHANECWEVFP